MRSPTNEPSRLPAPTWSCTAAQIRNAYTLLPPSAPQKPAFSYYRILRRYAALLASGLSLLQCLCSAGVHSLAMPVPRVTCPRRTQSLSADTKALTSMPRAPKLYTDAALPPVL